MQTIGPITVGPDSELGRAIGQALGLASKAKPPLPLPEAIVARMREALPRHVSTECPYKSGDLVKGRSDAPLPPMFKDRPLMVVETLREPHYSWGVSEACLPDHGKRMTVRVLFYAAAGDVDTIAPVWLDHADLEPYKLPAPQPEQASAT